MRLSKMSLLVPIVIALFWVSLVPLTWHAQPPSHAVTQITPAPRRTHVVRRGENLETIGRQYGLSWESIAAVNGWLNPAADNRCREKPAQYRDRSVAEGYYCNDHLRYAAVDGGSLVGPYSLQPGDVLYIP